MFSGICYLATFISKFNDNTIRGWLEFQNRVWLPDLQKARCIIAQTSNGQTQTQTSNTITVHEHCISVQKNCLKFISIIMKRCRNTWAGSQELLGALQATLDCSNEHSSEVLTRACWATAAERDFSDGGRGLADTVSLDWGWVLR